MPAPLPEITKNKAALMIAQGEFTYEHISAELDIDPKTLSNWRRNGDFRAKIEQLRNELFDEVKDQAIANRVHRVRRMNRRYERLQMVIDARAADPENIAVPGGDTGLLVRRPKWSPDGIPAFEFEVDTGTLAELRALEKQAAQELGQWTEKSEVSNTHSIASEKAEQARNFLTAVIQKRSDGDLPTGTTPIVSNDPDASDPAGPATAE